MTSSITPGQDRTDRPTDAGLESPRTTPSTLAGRSDESTGTSGPGSDAGLKAVVQKIRDMQQGATDLAKQYPAAASALRQAESALRAALRQIIANPGTPEPPSPNIGG